MAPSDTDKTVSAVARSLADGHDPEIERILISIAARAIRSDESAASARGGSE